MKLTKKARWFYLAITVCMTLLILSCEEKDTPTPIGSELEDVGSLINQSEDFTHFSNLIAIADQEIPDGQRGVLEMLSDTESGDQYTLFAPSDEIFEALALEWSGQDFQISVDDVIGEFTHNGQPAKTRDFVLGHIFRSDTRYESSTFENNLSLVSENGDRWRMILSENASSGFAFTLESNQSNSNPYLISQTDILLGINGAVHAALVN